MRHLLHQIGVVKLCYIGIFSTKLKNLIYVYLSVLVEIYQQISQKNWMQMRITNYCESCFVQQYYLLKLNQIMGTPCS